MSVKVFKEMTVIEYSKHRKSKGLPGTTRQAVYKALKEERIETEASGKINPEKADRMWEERTQIKLIW